MKSTKKAANPRINDIVRLLCQGRALSVEYMASKFEVTGRTIRRDLEFIRDNFKLTLKQDKVTKAWTCDARAVDLPATIISTEDRFALLVGRQAADLFRGTPWHERLAGAFTRILDTLHPRTPTNWKSIASRIRFEGFPQAEINARVWDVLWNGIESSNTVEIVYRSGDGHEEIRRLDPYALIVRNREWYVIGWDHRRRTVRTFFMPRIRSADDASKSFKIRDGFSLDAYLEGAIDSHQSNRPPSHVKLRFTRDASPAGQDFIWSRDQKSHLDGEGRLVVEFVARALFAVERHVLSWGGGVEVLLPEELRTQVRESALTLAKLVSADTDRP